MQTGGRQSRRLAGSGLAKSEGHGRACRRRQAGNCTGSEPERPVDPVFPPPSPPPQPAEPARPPPDEPHQKPKRADQPAISLLQRDDTAALLVAAAADQTRAPRSLVGRWSHGTMHAFLAGTEGSDFVRAFQTLLLK